MRHYVMYKRVCENCRFWITPTKEDRSVEKAECHRRAPASIYASVDGLKDEHVVTWPETYGLDTCGDFELMHIDPSKETNDG